MKTRRRQRFLAWSMSLLLLWGAIVPFGSTVYATDGAETITQQETASETASLSTEEEEVAEASEAAIEETKETEESQHAEETAEALAEEETVEEGQSVSGQANEDSTGEMSIAETNTDTDTEERFSVTIKVWPEDASVRVTDTSQTTDYSEQTADTVETNTSTEAQDTHIFSLAAGTYSYTVTAEGYYASVCAFTVDGEGALGYASNIGTPKKVSLQKEKAIIDVELTPFVASSEEGGWDGVTLDVTWFTPEATEYTITKPEELAGLAAIVNGIYNQEIRTIRDGQDYTPEEYATLDSAKIVQMSSAGDTSGPKGNNQVTSDTYYFGKYDFDGKTIYLGADLDMGGYYENGSWTGARFMPIGGQYTMHFVENGLSDGYSHLGSSFNGKLDGQGHIVYNIYCDRYSSTAFGDSQSIGLVGRLGNHDNDYETWQSSGDNGGNYPAKNPTVKNVAVTGYIYGRRSVGGIVGKIGQTSASVFSDGSTGGIVENCVNMATIIGTDAKGIAGIVGAGWNSGVIRNCVNFGSVTQKNSFSTGGIVGYNEVPLENCYNVGNVSAGQARYACAIGSNNGGNGHKLTNCYWLTGTIPEGGYGYYGSVEDSTQLIEMSTAASMQTEEFATQVSGDDRAYAIPLATDPISQYMEDPGYPVPVVFTDMQETIVELQKTADPTKLEYVVQESFDLDGLAVSAIWSDGERSSLHLPEDVVSYTVDGQAQELGYTFDTVGTHQITLTVEKQGITATYTYEVEVISRELASITITKEPTSAFAYYEGDTFAPEGLTVQITYTNQETRYAVYQNGKFVDTTDGVTEYGITVSNVAGTMTPSMTGQSLQLSYTETGITKTAQTGKTLYVLAGDNRPAQDENGVYLVGTAAELEYVAEEVEHQLNQTMSIRLTADITADGDFAGIGRENAFQGTFDGDGHTVTLAFDDDTENYVGLIGNAKNATIENVITAGTITAKSYVGGIVGKGEGVTIRNCGNRAVINGATYVGGIAGWITSEADSLLDSCYNKAKVTATSAPVGGIAGAVTTDTATVQNCYNWGTITGKGTNTTTDGVGGILGQIGAKATAKNLYNAGTVTNTASASRAGGIVGYSSQKKYGENFSNYYWEKEKGATYGMGASIQSTTGSKSHTDMLSLAATLGKAYQENDGCYPVLTWETVGHQYGDWTTTSSGKERTCRVCGNVETIAKYTITYDANGGSGAPGKQTFLSGETSTLSSTKPTRSGYTFQGWATSKTATTAQYQPGASYTGNGNVTLYAVWKKNVSANTNTGNNTSTVTVYRLYQPANGEHLYTTDVNEVRELAKKYGWTYEGSAWSAPASGTPVYRLYNQGLGSHMYTTDTNEVNTLVAKHGWQKDYDGKPLFYSGGDVSIYRLNNDGLGMHHWTTDANEYSTLPAYGWVQEGIGFKAKAKGNSKLAMP